MLRRAKERHGYSYSQHKAGCNPKTSLPLPRAPLPQGEGRVRAILLSRISPTALFTLRGSTNSVNNAVPILRWCEQKAGGQSGLTFG